MVFATPGQLCGTVFHLTGVTSLTLTYQTRGQSNLTKGRIIAPKIHARSALTKPEVVFLK